MTLSDLLFLLRLDLTQHGRLGSPKGKRTRKTRNWGVIFRIVLFPSISVIVGYVTSFILSLFDWPTISSSLVVGSSLLVMLLNLFLVFTLIGSIIFAIAVVGNSSRMEYLLVMPIRPRTIFIEKILALIFWGLVFWLSITVPVIYVFAIYSPVWYALLSVPVYVIVLFSLSALGTGIGSLTGLMIARIVAGRRLLREAGYFVFTSLAIVLSAIYYYSLYFGDSDTLLFEQWFLLAKSIGLSSGFSPGFIHGQVILGMILGTGVTLPYIFWSIVLVVISFLMLYVNGVLSEKAHYDGWLEVPTQRSTKRTTNIMHKHWDPQPFKFIKFSQTLSVSLWYNIASIRREGRVLAQYLLNPLRFAIFILLPAFTIGEEFGSLSIFSLMIVVVPFATSYGISFAGYEIVYEGRNLMNLQLAAANLEEYVRGKVYSALPFTFAVSVIVSIIVIIMDSLMFIYAPLLIVSAVFITLATGAFAAKQGAVAGDFKAERMILKQRGSAVRMPITGFASLKVGLASMLLGFGGLIGLVAIGLFISPLFAYLGLVGFVLLCWKIERIYSHSAGVVLAQIEADAYL